MRTRSSFALAKYWIYFVDSVDKKERKVYYRCERCGYEEVLTFEEAGVDDEEYAFFILKEDGTLTWECPESGIKEENAEEITDFSKYYTIEHLCPECCE